MKKYFPLSFIALLMLIMACSDSNDIIEEVEVIDNEPEVIEPNEYAGINNFIYGSMNYWYRWKDNVRDLADDRFPNNQEYNAYLRASGTPENFLETLVYNRQTVDVFTRLIPDWIEDAGNLAGNQGTNGVEFGLTLYGDDKILGYVQFILPGSDADGKDIARGDLFTEVNGVEMNRRNYQSLLFSENPTYTLNLSKLVGNTITPTGRTVELTKTDYEENPVLSVKVFEEAGKRIGYIHYIQFTAKESELNAAFLELKNQGISDLILDLRYNGGGYAEVSQALACMITGQFKGEVLTRQKYNDDIMGAYDEDTFQRRFIDRTTGSFSDEVINSLNLNSVHIITAWGTASASETLISGLSAYISVKTVGETTYGKYTGGATLYDSPTGGREDVNPDHTYALYPIFYTNTNSLGASWPQGISPNIAIDEDLGNMGIVGDRNEPLLQAAINDIVGIAAKTDYVKTFDYENIGNSRMNRILPTDLIESRPEFMEAIKKMKQKK